MPVRPPSKPFLPLSVPVSYFFYVMCMPRGSSWIVNVERFNATYRRNIADVHRDAASEPFTAVWPELQVKFKHNCTIKLTGDAAATSCSTKKRTANFSSRNGCCITATSGKKKITKHSFKRPECGGRALMRTLKANILQGQAGLLWTEGDAKQPASACSLTNNRLVSERNSTGSAGARKDR